MEIALFALRRLRRLIIIVFSLITIVFFLTRLVTDPVSLSLGPSATQEQRDVLTKSLGLDEPVPLQFVHYLGDLVRGDLGESLWLSRPALGVIIDTIPASVVLATAGMTLAVLVGVTLGVFGGIRPGSLVDRMTIGLSSAAMAVPDFWVGLIFIIVFAVQLGWLPTGGYEGLANWSYLIMPAATVALLPAGRLARVTRETVVEELGKAYVTTARARGLTMGAVIRKHVLKNIFSATATLVGYDFLLLFTGAVATIEVVFGWPGIGRLAVEATLQQDVVLISSMVIVTGVIVGVGNLLIETVVGAVDRRSSH